jgi:predicted Rossmann-fold nucleotide-binding protein
MVTSAVMALNATAKTRGASRRNPYRPDVIGSDSVAGPRSLERRKAEDRSMLRKLPIVAVFGQGSTIGSDRADLARAVGSMVARLGAHLLAGGGYGVMAAACDGFLAVADRAGWSIGVVPREPDGPLDMPNRAVDGRPYPNPSIEIAIITPLPPRVADWRNIPARNHINVFTADAIVALPGGVGTRNELDMAAAYRDESARPREERRTVLVGPIEEFAPEHRAWFVHAETIAAAERHLSRVLAGFPRRHEVGERAVS